jgi:molybdopterin-guanine dinucleotide biosynthesis protein A
VKTKISYQNISAAILAGGTNSRFNGRIKSLVPFHNKPIMEHQTEVLKSIFPEILLITNSPDRFANYKDLIIYTDIIPHKGPLSGIHTALKKSSHDQVFIVAGDMPFINGTTIAGQISAAVKEKYEAIIPRVTNNIEPLHGVYHKSGLDKLEALLQPGKPSSVKKFLETINTFYWEADDKTPFININTPEELSRYEKSEHHKNRER